MPGNAPTERVGGQQDQGPWPESVDEIVEGEEHTRPVQVPNPETGVFETHDVTVRVENIQQIEREDGTETDGYVSTYSFKDPNGGGT